MPTKQWEPFDYKPEDWNGKSKEIKACVKPEHCWHRTGLVRTSNPAQFDETCCHCDAFRMVMEKPQEISPEHGPFHPDIRT